MYEYISVISLLVPLDTGYTLYQPCSQRSFKNKKFFTYLKKDEHPKGIEILPQTLIFFPLSLSS